MNEASALDSGVRKVVSVAAEDASPLSPEALIATAHGILDAAQVALLSVAHLTEEGARDGEGAAIDAREGIERIAKIAQSLQAAARGAKAGRRAA